MAGKNIKKKVRFDYYQVFCYEINKEKNSAIEKLFDITGILNKAKRLKPKETMRSHRDDKARIQVIQKNETNNIWEIQLLRLRDSNPPGIATEDGEYEVFELEDGKYIGESTTVLYDRDNSILVMQRNKDSFTPTGLQEYLNEITKVSDDLIFFKPILCGVDIKKIKKSNVYKKISISIAGNELNNNIDNNSSLSKFLKDLSKYQANNIKIELSIGHGKKGESLDEALSYDVIKELYDKKFTNKLRVGYKDNEDASVEYLDLINDRRIEELIIDLKEKQSIDHKTLYPQIQDAYVNRKNTGTIF